MNRYQRHRTDAMPGPKPPAPSPQPDKPEDVAAALAGLRATARTFVDRAGLSKIFGSQVDGWSASQCAAAIQTILALTEDQPPARKAQPEPQPFTGDSRRRGR